MFGSLGACLIDSDRLRFDDFVKRNSAFALFEDSIEKPAGPGQLPSLKETVYEYFYDQNKNQWIAWEWIVPKYVHDPKVKFSEILVPTIDTMRTSTLLFLMSKV